MILRKDAIFAAKTAKTKLKKYAVVGCLYDKGRTQDSGLRTQDSGVIYYIFYIYIYMQRKEKGKKHIIMMGGRDLL